MKLHRLRIAALLLQALLAAGAHADDGRRLFIVQLTDRPIATYAGGQQGYPATRPEPGQRLDVRSPAAKHYAAYLQRKRDEVIRRVATIQVVRQFNLAMNGFSARMTEAEAAALAAQPGVASVQPELMHQPSTADSPRNLGLRDAGGNWTARRPDGVDLRGEGVIVGIIDTGIWPESLSFADRVDAQGVPTFDPLASLAYQPPVDWNGGCVEGLAFDPQRHCNNKLIGAKFFNDGFNATGYAIHWSEFAASPRDLVSTNTRGHGSHAASIAAGNEGVPVTMKSGVEGVMSGMAPRARIASYKSCWAYVNAAGANAAVCPTSDIVSAVEEAIQDGVHVLSVSIGGGETPDNAIEQAFLSATNVGIFVAAAASNTGPGNTVVHVGPWTTTVASSSIDRDLRTRVVLGNGSQYYGDSMNSAALPTTALVDAAHVGLAGVDALRLKTCQLGVNGENLLDPERVRSRVVLCLRGYTTFDVKSNVVRAAGGAAMIIQEYGTPTTVSAEYSLPTVLLSIADGALVKAYAATANAEVSFEGVRGVQNAPVINELSARGPNRFDPNVLKPDLAAPGRDIYASASEELSRADRDAIADGTRDPRDARMIKSGTSMATPHVGGMAALFKEGYPAWSPAQIKSALMTTAQSTLDDGRPGMQNGLLPWAKGAGRVHAAALNPGLTYNIEPDDYVRYLCRVTPTLAAIAGRCDANVPGGVGRLDETYNLNLPTITLAALDRQTVVRRAVTQVAGGDAVYNAAVVAPPGFTAVLDRQQLVFGAGQPLTQSYTVTLTPTAAAVRGQWAYGSLTWSDQHGHVVRSPLTVRRPLFIEIPAPIVAEGVKASSGSRLMSVRTGYSGAMTVDRAGLVAATLQPERRLVPEAMEAESLLAACAAGGPELPASIYAQDFVMPAEAVAARFALREAHAGAPGQDNFNLAVVQTNGGWSASSSREGSEESVTLPPLPTGTYRVCMHAASTSSGAADMTMRLSSWIATTANANANLSVGGPAAVVDGGSSVVTAAWRNLQPGQQYLGGLRFRSANGDVQGATPLFIDTRP